MYLFRIEVNFCGGRAEGFSIVTSVNLSKPVNGGDCGCESLQYNEGGSACTF
jgi:hypothetical protein